jgi:RNA-directed DNA polymerase
VFLHYVLDLWAHRWRRTVTGGDAVIVRYCDDFIVGFERRSDAQAFLADLRERLAEFRLELHPNKTRLVRFGRYADERARRFGERRAGTFRFLGFVHACGRSSNGRFLIVRHTDEKRRRATLKAVKTELMRRRHRPIPEQGAWLGQVLRGYFAYYAVPTNLHSLVAMRTEVTRHWRRALNRRSQRGRVTWKRMTVLKERWLPRARVRHSWPLNRFSRHDPRWEPGAVVPHAG